MTSTPATSNPIVLIAPAMAVGSGYYRPLVDSFTAYGWSARALPRRGFEPGEPRADRRHDWSYADEIADISTAATTAREEDPDRPVLLLGHSLGGQLSVGYATTHPLDQQVDGIITVGGALPHHRHYPGWGLHVAFMGAVIVPTLTTAFGYLPRPAFGGPGARTLMREWARTAVTGRTPFAGPRITTPSLLVSLQGDRLSPRRAVDVLSERFFDASATTRWHYLHRDRPAGASNDHITWVRTPDRVVDEIQSWWDLQAPRTALRPSSEDRHSAVRRDDLSRGKLEKPNTANR